MVFGHQRCRHHHPELLPWNVGQKGVQIAALRQRCHLGCQHCPEVVLWLESKKRGLYKSLVSRKGEWGGERGVYGQCLSTPFIIISNQNSLQAGCMSQHWFYYHIKLELALSWLHVSALLLLSYQTRTRSKLVACLSTAFIIISNQNSLQAGCMSQHCFYYHIKLELAPSWLHVSALLLLSYQTRTRSKLVACLSTAFIIIPNQNSLQASCMSQHCFYYHIKLELAPSWLHVSALLLLSYQTRTRSKLVACLSTAFIIIPNQNSLQASCMSQHCFYYHIKLELAPSWLHVSALLLLSYQTRTRSKLVACLSTVFLASATSKKSCIAL